MTKFKLSVVLSLMFVFLSIFFLIYITNVGPMSQANNNAKVVVKEEPMTPWKTFSSKDVNATFSYPNEWTFNGQDTWFIDRKATGIALIKNNNSTPIDTVLYFFYGPQKMSLIELGSQKNDLSNLAFRKEITTTSFDSQPGILITYYDENNVLTDVISYVNYKGMTYGFSSPGTTPADKELGTEFPNIKKVMESIKFTN